MLFDNLRITSSLTDSGDFCLLLSVDTSITDQARLNVGPDLDTCCLHLGSIPENSVLGKNIEQKTSAVVKTL